MSKTPGLYIHIPFCLSKCSYCDFYSVTSLSALPDFLNALFREMEMYRGRFTPFDTVYIGGGTPSLLGMGQLESLMAKVRENFDLASDPEITLETNPADLRQSSLESILEIGINRISIGVQSFDEKVLRFLGRRHSAGEAISAVEASRNAGCHHMGLDLIFGVPGQTLESWLDTLRQAVAFSPEHLSCYQLTVEAKTPLGARHQAGEFCIPGEASQHEFFRKTADFLENAGYIHYEVSNFARGLAYASRHNQKYWDHSPYLGLGPAAHSFQSNQRWWNHRSLGPYFTAINAGNVPVEEMEILTMEQLRLEALALCFRTKKGISLEDLKRQYDYDLLAEKGGILAKLSEEGLISIRDGCLSPTPAGLAVADRLAMI